MSSRENMQEAYFSTKRDGGQATGYGDAVVHVRVSKNMAQLDDEFPDGEQHYRIPVSQLKPEHFVNDKPASAARKRPNRDQTSLPITNPRAAQAKVDLARKTLMSERQKMADARNASDVQVQAQQVRKIERAAVLVHQREQEYRDKYNQEPK